MIHPFLEFCLSTVYDVRALSRLRGIKMIPLKVDNNSTIRHHAGP